MRRCEEKTTTIATDATLETEMVVTSKGVGDTRRETTRSLTAGVEVAGMITGLIGTTIVMTVARTVVTIVVRTTEEDPQKTITTPSAIDQSSARSSTKGESTAHVTRRARVLLGVATMATETVREILRDQVSTHDPRPVLTVSIRAEEGTTEVAGEAGTSVVVVVVEMVEIVVGEGVEEAAMTVAVIGVVSVGAVVASAGDHVAAMVEAARLLCKKKPTRLRSARTCSS